MCGSSSIWSVPSSMLKRGEVAKRSAGTATISRGFLHSAFSCKKHHIFSYVETKSTKADARAFSVPTPIRASARDGNLAQNTTALACCGSGESRAFERKTRPNARVDGGFTTLNLRGASGIALEGSADKAGSFSWRLRNRWLVGSVARWRGGSPARRPSGPEASLRCGGAPH